MTANRISHRRWLMRRRRKATAVFGWAARDEAKGRGEGTRRRDASKPDSGLAAVARGAGRGGMPGRSEGGAAQIEIREVILSRRRPGPLIPPQLICLAGSGCSDREPSGMIYGCGVVSATQTIVTGQGLPRLTNSCPEALASDLWKWLGAARQRRPPFRVPSRHRRWPRRGVLRRTNQRYAGL
jgi:hypothetical protein